MAKVYYMFAKNDYFNYPNINTFDFKWSSKLNKDFWSKSIFFCKPKIPHKDSFLGKLKEVEPEMELFLINPYMKKISSR